MNPPASAETVSNYSVDKGVTIQAARLDTNLRTVILETSSLTEGAGYVLRVNNVRDRSAAANPIAPGSQIAFSYNNLPTTGLALWLQGDTGTIPGSGISQWLDQSGNGRHAGQPALFGQPALRDGVVAGGEIRWGE